MNQTRSEEEVHQEIKNTVENHPVVLFMKGTPDQPMCGFSAQVVKVLEHVGKDFHSINVLEDWDIREGIKSYTNWPTIPQLYVKGEFVGGCDIIMEMARKGEIQAVFENV